MRLEIHIAVAEGMSNVDMMQSGRRIDQLVLTVDHVMGDEMFLKI